MRRIAAVLLVAGLVAGLAPHAGARPTQVFKDPAGDAGNHSQSVAVPGAEQAGFDMVRGSIERHRKHLMFRVSHAAMPPSGSLPEGFRLLWHFNVDGREYRLTVKSQDIGEPDVIAQNGTERIGRVDTEGHFRLERCAEEALPAVLTLVNCGAIAYLKGAFNPESATVTIPVPLRRIKARRGSRVAGGTSGAASTQCQVCWVPQFAERSLTPVTIIDAASVTRTFRVR